MGSFSKNKLLEGSDSKMTIKIENTKNNCGEYDLIGFLRKRVGVGVTDSPSHCPPCKSDM